jgi:hypothetical protein
VGGVCNSMLIVFRVRAHILIDYGISSQNMGNLVSSFLCQLVFVTRSVGTLTHISRADLHCMH